MTKKRFVELAKTIAEIQDEDLRVQVAVAVAEVAAKTNPRFDAQRFFSACGVVQ